ncbi:amino acid ABC transporter permease [Streptomyces sp. NPDC050433]|uniref:amino acid ABC transporter permease n=1 Tax=Streptomyces sp. NPDC050433 TaxID=3365615 RepID=UPI00378F9C2C
MARELTPGPTAVPAPEGPGTAAAATRAPRPPWRPGATDAAAAARRPRPGQWTSTVVVLLAVAWLAQAVVTNKALEWSVVADYLTFPSVLRGLAMTLELTVFAMAAGILGGVLLALMRTSRTRLLRIVADGYIWIFRGTPVLVQLILWYNLAIFVPTLSIGIPFGPELVSWQTNALITPFVASLLGLALSEAAYMGEIMRAGLLSVPTGQREAAQTLGIGRAGIFTRIVLPQAMRSIVPPTGNQVINMLKGTSLVSVIAMGDLLYSVQAIYHQNFKTIPLLVVACIWYLVVTSVLYVGQAWVERRFGRGFGV